jgi:DNA-binding CsgD family transcriptional regulator
MNNSINIPFEILLMGIQFATLWLLFYKLYHQESKIKRILLVICIVLSRPLDLVVFGPVYQMPLILRILIPIAAYAILVILAGGKKRNVCIMAVYYWSIVFLVDIIGNTLYFGFTGNRISSNNDVYIKASLVYFFSVFLWAVFYYLVMRAVPQEALKRLPLRIWIVILFTPLIGGIAVYVVNSPLSKQLDAGLNNYLLLGFFCIILLVFNLIIFYLFIKLVSSYNAPLLAGEINKTESLYTLQNGLSPEFIEKYGLSNRQVEITEALLQGKSNKEISILLNIELNTVQVHVQNVYRKTGAPGRYALMALVGIGK